MGALVPVVIGVVPVVDKVEPCDEGVVPVGFNVVPAPPEKANMQLETLFFC